MIGDIINIEERHLEPAIKIVEEIKGNILASIKYAITVGGESGSGKSTLALAVRKILEEEKIGCFIFHMDDYFKLPPATNHAARIEDINWVGPQEVRLDLLQEHVDTFKAGVAMIEKPLVHYKANNILSEGVNLSAFNVIIVEGTYTSILNNIDTKIFMLRNYKDTLADRVKRARDPIVPFNEQVLKIEHNIISGHVSLADILVDKEYGVTCVGKSI
jgi:uridine kinase